MFNPDRSRTRLEEDELGRKGFVRSVWRALRNHDASEAIVISIQAPWGDGKTTLKDMVVNLEETEGKREKLLFVHFNPWEWAAQNQVATAFFRELAKQLDRPSSDNLLQAASKKLSKAFWELPAYLRLGSTIARSTNMALVGASPEAAVIAAGVGAVLKTAEESFKEVKDSKREAEQPIEASAQQKKAEVRAACEVFRQETRRNIVVFIDDIDRLSGDEIRQVLQLVKINADFPGLIFVLLFDKEYVERRLRRHFGSDAGRLLEKIVQVELTLPKASEDQLYGTFKTAVQDALKKRPAYLAIFEEDRLKQAFDVWFHYHLVNPRKSGRLVSGWAFRLDVFDTGAAEVNPVDLLILEGIALYEPAVYRALSADFWRLFHSNTHDYMADRAPAVGEPSRRMQVLMDVARAGSGPVDPLILLKLLLGVTGDDFTDVSGDEYGLRIRSVRFSHRGFARRYFRLTIDSGDIARAIMVELVNAIGTPSDFTAQLTNLESQGVLLDALDQLLAGQPMPPQRPSHFLSELLDWWEQRILQGREKMEETELHDALIQLYEHVMGRTEGTARFGTLQSMLMQTNSVYALIAVASYEEGKRHQRSKSGSSDSSGILDETGERELCDAVARRLAQKFEIDAPSGRSYEVEACSWAQQFAGTWRRDIGTGLIRTAAGTFVLLRGTIGRFLEVSTVTERRRLAELIERMVDLEHLSRAVLAHQEELIALDFRAENVPGILKQILAAQTSSDSAEASGDPDSGIPPK